MELKHYTEEEILELLKKGEALGLWTEDTIPDPKELSLADLDRLVNYKI